jgi:predicted GNAT family acetyltransferase
MVDEKDITIHQPENNRYLVQFHDGGEGELVYQRDGDTLNLVHSQVPSNRRGAGLGARLMDNALAQIEADHLKVRPICSYTGHYISRSERWQSLLAS